MSDARARRGSAARGERRLRAYVIAVVAMLAACAEAPSAVAASGGAGTGPPSGGKRQPSAQHRAPARPHTKSPRASRGGANANPLASRGMWIWYVSQADGGNIAAILATAHRYGIGTLVIKSGDGSSTWSQFNPQLVGTLHAHGLRVCGWQYVYGNSPVAEARVGAATVRAGADCLMIDAEGEYEGKYVQAQTYMRTLRASIGAAFPLALAGLPYVDYHPAFPYSVFLGPGGAQYNAPQMYWADIGVSVDTVFTHTYEFNQIYQRPIFPLGQVSSSPPPAEIRRFRQLSRVYGASGLSWWDWQEATPQSWSALAQPVGTIADYGRTATLATLGRGAQGDLVVWAQEHLRSAGQSLDIDGAYGPATTAAVMKFQRAHALPAVGLIGPATWQALLRYPPVAVRWTAGGARTASAAGVGDTIPVPPSASLPAKRYEIGRSLGRG